MIELNNVRVVPTLFPDGTSQVWNVSQIFPDTNRILWEFESEAEIMHIAQLAMLLEGTRVRLSMPFLPYGRQDKPVSNDATFAVRAFASLMRTINFDSISTLDAHSDVFLKLTGAVNSIPLNEIKFAISECRPSVLGFPDAGAERRYASLTPLDFVVGAKARDPRTGRISYHGVTGADPAEKTVLIVDDICDGGATFCRFAELLLARGAAEIHLYTTHGIYSKGFGVLRDAGIKRIFNRKGELT